MKRVLMIQPSLQPPGGSNGVAAWALQALVAEHRVTVLTWHPVDVDPVNRFYGTRLVRSQFDTIIVPRSYRALLDHLPVPAALLKQSLLMRYTREVSAGFDILFGLHNETDYGRRGIQYLHYPAYLRPRPKVDLRWYHPPQAGLDVYYAFADRLAGFSLDRLKTNLTLVNSDWTGSRVSSFLGIPTRTLYPPIVDPAPGLPWADRRSAFLALGRISPEKEYERVMRILARVRVHIPDLTLTIIGTSDRHTRGYLKSLLSQAKALGPWIQFRDNLARDDVRSMMASHRYAIHGMREEHFGMAPAELARAGVIVWVPRGGGQTEIVAGEPALTYETDDDAVRKILAVLGNPDEQRRLHQFVTASSDRFSTERFMQQVRAIVNEFEA
jgi:glycosyltransferase involved in cell wall biosynthesis